MGSDRSRFDIVMGGSGGQGVLTAGLLLARTGMAQYQHVSWFPSYMAAMRGGSSDCTVILSENIINSPILSKTQAVIAMDQTSYARVSNFVADGGILIYNSSLIHDVAGRDEITVVSLPANQLAQGLGSIQVANLILLGAYLEIKRPLSFDEVKSELEQMLKEEKRENLLPLNIRALEQGIRAVSN